MRVSSILTAGIFTAWLLTLGVRMAYPATSSNVATNTSSGNQSQTASVANSDPVQSQGNTLEVVQTDATHPAQQQTQQ